MARYAVLIFERAELDEEQIQEHVRLAGRIAEHGGRVVAGLAVEPPATAVSIRDGLVTDGPFIETKEVMAGIFVIEARDLDHAITLARMTPVVDGGVEVRPLIDFQVLEDHGPATAPENHGPATAPEDHSPATIPEGR